MDSTNIVKINSVIAAKKTIKVKKSAKSFKVKITLKGKNIKQQTVKVKFNGKTYTLKTDANGIATLKVAKKVIKKLKKGKTYSYTISYNKDQLKGDVKVI